MGMASPTLRDRKCVFRANVTARFGIVTAHFGDRPEGAPDRRQCCV